jgi:hypothetical protein
VGRRRLRLRGCSGEVRTVRVLRENYEYIGPLSGVVLIEKRRVLLVSTKLTDLSILKNKNKIKNKIK